MPKRPRLIPVFPIGEFAPGSTCGHGSIANGDDSVCMICHACSPINQKRIDMLKTKDVEVDDDDVSPFEKTIVFIPRGAVGFSFHRRRPIGERNE
jgi:hypothetical protein